MDNVTSNEQLALQDEMNQTAIDAKENSAEVEAILSVETEEETTTEETIEELTNRYSALSREELVSELRELCHNADYATLKSKPAVLRSVFNDKTSSERKEALAAFVAQGGKEEDFASEPDEQEKTFYSLYAEYKEKRQRHIEQQEKEKQENLEKKKAVLDELRELLRSEGSLKEIYDKFNEIQDKWKSIGAVPRGEINSLWENYRFLIEQFFDKVKISRELRDMGLKKNLEEKLALCERVEGLMLCESINDSFKQLQECHQHWKEIGPVPQEKRDEIWERFKSTTDKINQIRRDHYAKIEEEQKANYDAKVAICEKMEEIVNEPVNSINAYQKKSNEVNELFKLWKQVGPIHKKQSDEIWNRFKGSMNSFFDSKKEFFSKLKVQQMENYNKKLQICVEVENLVDSTEWKKTTDYIKKLQEEWKNIGPVPKRHSDKIWKRFRTACDAFFKNKSEHFSSIKGKEDDNLKAKQQVIENIKAYELKKDRNENMEAIRGFQREWMSIGHVPMKMKDALQKEYRDLIDGLFDKMRANDNELSTTEFRNMVNGMKDDPGSRDKIRRERINLQSKIQKLRDEIATLENNIGFFAASKQSDLLKAEYEKKIAKIKNDVKVLEAKMKIINEQ